MKISTILDHIDSGYMALPEFQRGYVWNRDQVRGLFDSLYRRHPVGGLLVWVTESRSAIHRGDGALAPGVVKLLLDGQQRMTSLYGVVRGRPPRFFDGNAQAFTGLRFHLAREAFAFYQPVTMKDDPLWIDVTELTSGGQAGLGAMLGRMSADPAIAPRVGEFAGRLSTLLGVMDIDLHVEEVTGADKSLDVVVDIFNRVNSGGTKLSKGDLALAKICADWPQARAVMRDKLTAWESEGYGFNLDWLLRSVNTVLTGEAKFQYLHEKDADQVRGALERTTVHIESVLNLVAGRLGLDHDRVFFGRFAVPVMVRYLELVGSPLNERRRDKLLFWYAQAAMWGRFSGSTETFIDKDLEALEGPGPNATPDADAMLDRLIEQLRLWHGGLRAQPDHFTGWSKGARFYPVLYLLTRMGGARDWGSGLPLMASLLGKKSRLEVHHIFPKSLLYEAGGSRRDVNALGNYCFLTKDTNLDISNRPPEAYFPAVEKAHPGALASQWIPQDPDLWKIDQYPRFLEARKRLLADELNARMAELLHGEDHWLSAADSAASAPDEGPAQVVLGGFASDQEERELEALNLWVRGKGLPMGELSYELSDPGTGAPRAVLDLVWPTGLQEELSEPVAVLLAEESQTIALASGAGYRCFTSIEGFKRYVLAEILADVPTDLAQDDAPRA